MVMFQTLTTVRQGISEALKFRGSLKIVENCNFRGINFRGFFGCMVLFILVVP